ncbi:hypothetical protein GLYMA_03G141450v4 [Glycine max]|nr:hypothetical protein GLYMA_03G141450v4 [Glycine max]KAH1069956.1 hypothetical protein GYH30_007195 [Glycine max]
MQKGSCTGWKIDARQTATRHVLTIPVGLVPWKRAEPEEEAHEAL